MAVKIKQAPEAEVATEVLAAAIVAMAEGNDARARISAGVKASWRKRNCL
jgi:hypothetical protein